MRPCSYVLSLLLVSPLLAACNVSVDSADTQGPAAPAPTSLRDVQIDPDFTFASTRSVTVQFQINVKSVSSDKPFPIEVWNLRKEMLVQAELPKSGVFSTDFPLPLGDHDLVVKLGDKELPVTVGDDNIARATFH